MEDFYTTITKVKYNGPFVLSEIYQKIFRIFLGMGYYPVEGLSTGKYEKISRVSGDDYAIIWECYADYDSYTRGLIKYTLLIFNAKPVDFQKDGKNIKGLTGNVDIELRSRIQTDYNDVWDKNAVTRFMKYFYDNHLYKKQIEQWRKKSWDETYAIGAQIKEVFYF